MVYGHADLLATLGSCAITWCSAPAYGAEIDGSRYCPRHGLEVLRDTVETAQQA